MISVVIPCKNIIREGREFWFHMMMASLSFQSYKDVETIVIDGASQDGTLDLLQQYVDDRRITRLVSEPDRNVNAAMNKGIGLADGDFIHIMSSDTILTDGDFYATSLSALEQEGIDYTHADRIIMPRGDGHVETKKGDLAVAYFQMPFRHETMLIRRSIYQLFGPLDDSLDIAADYKLLLLMHMHGTVGTYFPRVYVNSRAGGISSDREKCIIEVGRVLHECYGSGYGLTIEDCEAIYQRRFSPELMDTIEKQVHDEAIRRSLQYAQTLGPRW